MRVLSAYLILGVTLWTLATCRARPRAQSAPDYDDYRDEPFDPNWVHNYDTLDIPPCPGWNPIDGCGRTPARTKPPGPTSEPTERTSPPAPVYTTQHGPYHGHRLQCTPEEEKKAACLHGGICFVMNMMDTRVTSCQCGEMWAGRRCELIDESSLVLTAEKIEKAGIIAGVVVLLIIITVIIIYVVVKKRKQRKHRSQENGNANGHAGKALMSPDKENIECEETEKCTDV